MLKGAVLSRASFSVLTVDFRMDVHTFISILALGEEGALDGWVEVWTLIVRKVALGPMPALERFLVVQMLLLLVTSLLLWLKGLSRFRRWLLLNRTKACQSLAFLFICCIKVNRLFQIELGVVLLLVVTFLLALTPCGRLVGSCVGLVFLLSLKLVFFLFVSSDECIKITVVFFLSHTLLSLCFK